MGGPSRRHRRPTTTVGLLRRAPMPGRHDATTSRRRHRTPTTTCRRRRARRKCDAGRSGRVRWPGTRCTYQQQPSLTLRRDSLFGEKTTWSRFACPVVCNTVIRLERRKAENYFNEFLTRIQPKHDNNCQYNTVSQLFFDACERCVIANASTIVCEVQLTNVMIK